MAYNLFLSHSWTYRDAYTRLIEMLRAVPRFDFKDYSIPKDDPIHNASNANQLRAAIKLQMQSASVVLIMAGKYATFSKWINEESFLAQGGFENAKPILAAAPWGAQQISSKARDAADEVVAWNSISIADAINDILR